MSLRGRENPTGLVDDYAFNAARAQVNAEDGGDKRAFDHRIYTIRAASTGNLILCTTFHMVTWRSFAFRGLSYRGLSHFLGKSTIAKLGNFSFFLKWAIELSGVELGNDTRPISFLTTAFRCAELDSTTALW